MKNLVTGGAGFLGSHLIDNLINKNEKVICLDNYYTGTSKNIEKWLNHPNFKLIEHDITDPIQIETDKLWHLACPASPLHYQLDPIKTARTSFLGTYNMLELATRVHAKILFASSSEIYGNAKVNPQYESYHGNVNPIGLRSCYDEGKRVGETLCYFYKIKHNVDVSIFRPFNVFGPGMPRNDYRVFPRFFSSIKDGKPITIFKNGKQTRTFCYVADAITAMFIVIIVGKTFVYNIGNNKPELNMNKLHKCIQTALSKKIRSINISYPKNYPQVEPQRRCPDITKLSKEFGYKNKVNILDAIKRYFKWSSRHY